MSKDDELIFLPLGGSGEIGMNMNLYAVGPAHKRQWIMVDCGVTFAGLQTPGIDLITPDPEYLLDDVERGGGKLHGLMLTHGHEDHIGAVATLWPYLKCPIYASAFTAGLVERKFAEADIIDPPINVIDMGARFTLGPFDLEYVTLTHSIPEPSGVIIRTGHGTLLHTGDWKIDKTPSLGPVTDNNKLVELSKEGVLAMICDSTNVLTAGESGSESVVQKNLIDLISRLEGKVAVTTFASNVGRLVSVCEAAKQNDRAVCLLGRSMLRMIEVAKETGILPSGYAFVEPDEAGYLPNNKVLYLCTGSQGEARAALGRIARDDHRDITLGQGDTVIFSSKIIPGNEREIFDLQNALVELGVDIITEKDEFIHVSGHPCRDELEQMYDWVKPQYAIPVHGEARHLEEHAKFAEAMGVDKAISPRNGDMIRLAPGEPAIIDEVPSGRLLLDGTILTPEGGLAIRDRRKIAYAGLIVVAVALDSKDNVLAPPEVSIAGLPPRDRDGEEFQVLLEDRIEDTVDALSHARRRDDGEIELAIKRSLRDFLKRRWGKRPNVRVLIIRG